MQLLQEMKKRGHNISSTTPNITCKVLKDNEGALELARFPKIYSRTKHINKMYYHFRSYVSNSNIKIYLIETSIQIGDRFTKKLPKE